MKKVLLISALLLSFLICNGCSKKEVTVYLKALNGDTKPLYTTQVKATDNVRAFINKHNHYFTQDIAKYEKENLTKRFIDFKMDGNFINDKTTFFNRGKVTITPFYDKKGVVVIKYDTTGAPEGVNHDVIDLVENPDYNLDLNKTIKYKGHVFGGWYLDKKLTTPLLSRQDITHDVTLYAKWIKSAKSVQIKLVGAKAVPFDNVETQVLYTTKNTPYLFESGYLKTPTLKHHEFLFWSPEKNPTPQSPRFNFKEAIKEDITLFACYKEDKHDVVRYIIPEDKLTPTIKLQVYDLHIYKKTKIKDAQGYQNIVFDDEKFVRFEITINNEKVIFNPNIVLDKTDSDITNLYLVEAIFLAPDEFTCRFEDTDIYDVTFKKDSDLLVYENTIPNINAKVFLGWFKDKDRIHPFDFSLSHDKNITIYPLLIDVRDFFETNIVSIHGINCLALTKIKNESALDKSAITYVGLPDELGSIAISALGKDLFYNYPNLKFVRLSENIEKVESQTVFGNTPWFNSLPQTSNIVWGKLLFKYQANEQKYQLPRELTAIAAGAFKENEIIEEILLHDNIWEINEYTFKSCINLKHIDLQFIREIKDEAFAYCPQLDDINLHYCHTLGAKSFLAARKLSQIKYRIDLKNIGLNAFAETALLEKTFKEEHRDYFVINNILVKVNPKIIISNNCLIVENGKANELPFDTINSGAISDFGSKVITIKLIKVGLLLTNAISNNSACQEIIIDNMLHHAQKNAISAMGALTKITIDLPLSILVAPNFAPSWHGGYHIVSA